MPESTTSSQTHYEVLALPTNPSQCKNLTNQDIRLAYRRALLLHHPDKSPTTTTTPSSNPTIDAITLAYKTLIDPTTRSEYDRSLLLLTSSSSPSTTRFPYNNNNDKTSHAGLETVDLDAMGYDAKEEMWYRSCHRCGKGGMYVITEEELELNADYGETITQCQGCSLWLRVTFAVVDEDG